MEPYSEAAETESKAGDYKASEASRDTAELEKQLQELQKQLIAQQEREAYQRKVRLLSCWEPQFPWHSIIPIGIAEDRIIFCHSHVVAKMLYL